MPDPVPVVDGLMAATALVHDWTLVTRNVDDVAPTGARFLDPFARDIPEISLRADGPEPAGP